MNLSRELILPVFEKHSALSGEEHNKWILSFKPKTTEWTMTDMKDTIHLFQKTGYKENVYDEELVVESESDATILRVNGIHNISLYCEYENPKTARGSWYKYKKLSSDTDNSQLPDIFSQKISSYVREEHLLEDNQVPPQWASSLKSYEICKKITYTDPKTGIVYMICMTKRTNEPFQTMLASGVSGMVPIIDYYIECPTKMDPKDAVVCMVRMIQILEQNSSPITIEQQKEVLSNYDSLIDKIRDKKYFKDPYYLAPKPVTLEQVHVSDPELTYGQISILNGYAVTDKADGERMLLFVDENGNAYMINNAFEVRGTGWKVKRDILYNTILDGEYLPSSKRLDGSNKDMFACFDVYFVGGKSVIYLPLMKTKTSVMREKAKDKEKQKKTEPHIVGDTRVDIMNSILNDAMWHHEKDTSIELTSKVHIAATGNDMFLACRKILEDATKKGSPYDIDGLVFTPVDLPVLGYYPNKSITIKNASSTWDRVLKWKPPSQNSIDFCISVDKNTIRDIKHHVRYAKLTLSCGYSALKNEEISVSRGLQLLQTRISERNLGDDYILKSFTPQYYYEEGIQYAYVQLSSDGVLRAENGDEINDGAIVEFGYDINDKRSISYRWRAMRVRNDKMRNIILPTISSREESEPKGRRKERYQIKTIKANDWKTATGIWRSIHEPVSNDMITGVERAPQLVKQAIDLQTRLLGTDAVYYGRNVTREHLLSVEMLNFHNAVIKDNLYKWPQQLTKNSLLELACGMAGDMNRWQDPETGFSFRNILGVDLVRDNITKAVDGAYARVLKPRYGAQRKHQNYVFVIGDCAKPLYNGACSKGLDKDSEDVLKELYGKPSGRRLLTIIPPFAKNKFDMVSCQFAIHYFFETQQKLEGFMANVRDNLRPGGIFISTFMDGSSVEKLIRDKGKKGLVEGRKLDGKVVVWAIRRIFSVDKDSISENEEEAEYIGGSYIEKNPQEDQEGGARKQRKKEMIEVYDPDKKTKKSLSLVDVPGLGDCMFISLEIAAFGEEKSVQGNGSWMRKRIIDKMVEILSKDDEKALDLYESIKLHVDNLSPDIKDEASEELYSSDSKKTYAERVSGYIRWMSKKRVWGTQIELRVAMYYLERPLYIYQTTGDKTVAHTIGMDLYPNKEPVLVWFNGKNHYKALLQEKETVVAEPEKLETFPTIVAATVQAATNKEASSPFGRLIDVYLENTNRLIPEYLVDFNILYEYATRYGLELVQDGMFSDTYQAFKEKNPDAFPMFDKDPVQQQFSFLNRWVVFRRV